MEFYGNYNSELNSDESESDIIHPYTRWQWLRMRWIWRKYRCESVNWGRVGFRDGDLYSTQINIVLVKDTETSTMQKLLSFYRDFNTLTFIDTNPEWWNYFSDKKWEEFTYLDSVCVENEKRTIFKIKWGQVVVSNP